MKHTFQKKAASILLMVLFLLCPGTVMESMAAERPQEEYDVTAAREADAELQQLEISGYNDMARLPSTGGIGTEIYRFSGLALMAGTVFCAAFLKKKKAGKFLTVLFAITLVMTAKVTVFAQTSSYSGTDSVAAVIVVRNPAKGQCYAVYRVCDASEAEDGSTVYSGGIPEELLSYFQKINGAEGYIRLAEKDISMEVSESEALKAWADDETPTAQAVSDGDGELEFTNLPYGYYAVVTGGGVGAVAVTPVNSGRNGVLDKNDQILIKSLEIEITKAGEASVAGDVTEAYAVIGDRIIYQVTFQTANYKDTTQIREYVIQAFPTGLEIDRSSVSVQVAGTAITPTIEKDGSTGTLTIKIPWVNTENSSLYANAAEVKLTYEAELKADRGENEVIVEAWKENEQLASDTVKAIPVKITTTNISNVDRSNNSTVLLGAEFRLYDAQNGGNEIKVKKNTQGVYEMSADGTDPIVMNEAGKVTVIGLKPGNTYWLEQTKAPTGYIMASGRSSFTTSMTDCVNTVSFSNAKGTTVPKTGGTGTTIFRVSGIVIMLSVGMCFTMRKKVSGKAS